MNLVKKLGGWMLPVVLMIGLMFPVHALAAVDPEKYQCDAELPVSVETAGKSDTPAVVSVAYKDGEKQPGDASEITLSDYTISYSGDGTQKVKFHYTAPGDYVYLIRQVAGDAERVTYDAAVYTVTIQVTNDDNGGLEAEIYAQRDSSKEKSAEVKFTNTYTAPTATPAPTAEPTSATAAPTAAPNAAPTAAPTAKPISALPKTGDSFPLIALAVIAIIAAAGFGLVAYRKKNNSEK